MDGQTDRKANGLNNFVATWGSSLSSVQASSTTPGRTKQQKLSTWPFTTASSPTMPCAMRHTCEGPQGRQRATARSHAEMLPDGRTDRQTASDCTFARRDAGGQTESERMHVCMPRCCQTAHPTFQK
jgi:hypothetical protein